ncbi:MAG: type III secretion system stator protein SctL [Alphaproteobacteria bacterium]|nr:type III secretion system stator protein SctL [Alphaproteobacteria bacterium]
MVCAPSGETFSAMPLVTILKQGAWRAHGRVMKHADYARATEAAALLSAARDEAAESARLARAAYAEEKSRGYRDGLADAHAELARMQTEQVARARDWVEGMERQLGALVATAVERILGEMDDTEVLARVVRRALENFEGLPSLRLRAAPDQVESLNRFFGADGRRAVTSPLRIEPDTGLRSGECVLESPLGVVDLSLPRQLEVLREALEGRDG